MIPRRTFIGGMFAALIPGPKRPRRQLLLPAEDLFPSETLHP